MQLSIIVPILNEKAQLPELLEHLHALQRHGCEILLVDGGSDDHSPEIARSLGFAVLKSPRGRACQMNVGAKAAKGDILLFLHADTRLPEFADVLVTAILTHPRHCWGYFAVRIQGKPLMLHVVATLMTWRSRLSSVATGDQALFMRRDAFDSVGGFPEQPLMEDIEMSHRLRRLSRPAFLLQRVTTSGRRWESRGVWSTIFLMWRLRWAYWRGISAEALAGLYQ
ncbi:MAG: glycosyltransferase family 2 protein [Pseudomonadales bacterium]|nr:glycosyltransferase family 2 protein [Pseudomonadales bacterium]